MAGSGYKNFTTGSVLTASDVQNYLMDQSVMVFAGTASRGSAITSPSEGMVVYLSDTDTVQVYNGTSWSAVGGGAAVLSNTPTGTYTSGGTAYAYYEFTASGTATVTKAGFADVLVVGGGGGASNAAGGGGAGACVSIANVYLAAGSPTITVGAGGGQLAVGNRSEIVLSDKLVTAIGGGIGGRTQYGEAGACGGGGSGGVTGTWGGGNGLYDGRNGGSGQGVSGVSIGGGGGGGNGANGTAGTSTGGGNGGAGVASTITGSSVTYGGGGGGYGSSTSGAGGSGGGGAGSTPTGGAGTANTGGGGGGSTGTGGSGGSGIVIIRVRT